MRHLMKGTPRLPLAAIATLTIATAACADPGGGEWQGSVRDSAGIEIVSNPATGLWAAGREWTVREDLRIGTAEGEPEYQFGQIAGIEVDAEGRIYVIDQQARQVRVFDSAGRFLHAVGKGGSGPGELSQAAGPVFVGPDGTVTIPDFAQQRITRYSPAGEPDGSTPLPMTDGIPLRWMEAPDGDLIQQAMIMALPNQPEVEPRNLVLRRAPTGEVRDTLLVLPLGQTMDFSRGQPRLTLFAPEPTWAIAPDGRLIAGVNSEYRFRVHSPDGRVRRIIERAAERKSLTESDQEEFRRILRQAWQQAGMPPQAMDMMARSLHFAEHYPAYANLFGGPEGTTWVQSVQTPESVREQGGTFDIQDIGGPTWDVFDHEGRYLGQVRMPGRFNPLLFHDDYMYGVLRDELDVQYVARVALERGARG